MANAATGGATLTGATVNVFAVQGPYSVGQQYTILSAGGGLGGTTFAGATSNLAFLRPTLSYDADDVFLTLTQGSFTSGALTRNQFAVATGLNNAVRMGGTSQPVIVALDQLTPGQAAAVLDSLSGEGIAATQNLAHREAGMFTSAIFDQTTFYVAGAGNQIVLTAPTPGSSSGAGFVALAPQDTLQAAAMGRPIRELADLPSSRPAFLETAPVAPIRTWRAWGTGFGANEDIHSNAAIGYAAQMNTIYGGAVGVDYQVAGNARSVSPPADRTASSTCPTAPRRARPPAATPPATAWPQLRAGLWRVLRLGLVLPEPHHAQRRRLRRARFRDGEGQLLLARGPRAARGRARLCHFWLGRGLWHADAVRRFGDRQPALGRVHGTRDRRPRLVRAQRGGAEHGGRAGLRRAALCHRDDAGQRHRVQTGDPGRLRARVRALPADLRRDRLACPARCSWSMARGRPATRRRSRPAANWPSARARRSSPTSTASSPARTSSTAARAGSRSRSKA